MIAKNAYKSNARQRILDTSERLFYAEGFRAVGVDRVVAEADVAKMTLYNHFPSKDDLMLATLKQQEAKVATMFDTAIKSYLAVGEARLDAFFLALGDWFQSPGFRGCSFINARVELADPDHPVSKFSAAHKQRFHAQLAEIVAEAAGHEIADSVAPAITLIVEGAIVAAVMQQSPRSAEIARKASNALISAATGH